VNIPAERVYFATLVTAGLVKWRGSVISWLRSVLHNTAIGGHEHSLHLWGLAIDSDFMSEVDARGFIADMEEHGFSCIYKPGGHSVHCQRWPLGVGPRPRPQGEE
jgi:hypothetical protein